MEILEVKLNDDKSVQSLVITTPNLVIGETPELSAMEQSTLLNAISQTLPDINLSDFNSKCSVSKGFVYDSKDNVVKAYINKFRETKTNPVVSVDFL
tara:strand:+ start:413 stop:703 length:291 start_codon:yes stop_codon:yes gene_type:complete